MKAALCKSLDGSAGVVLEEVADPVAGEGEAVVRVEAAALNFFDTLITRGKYQSRPELPFSPSGEIAGVIEAVGSGVTGFAAGDRVAAYVGWGGAAEKVAVKAEALIPVPNAVSSVVASGISITYGTAIHGLRDRAELKPGETVAVLGASGGAGLAAVEIAKLMGAAVIAAASSGDKLETCRQHGADHLIDYTTADLRQALKEATGGRGVDVVYDCVGDAYAEASVRALAWEGRYLVVGFAGGQIPKLPLNLLLLKGASAIGVFWGESVRREPDRHLSNMRQVLEWIAAGQLQPRIHGIFPLSQAREALAVIERREAVGKVVITP